MFGSTIGGDLIIQATRRGAAAAQQNTYWRVNMVRKGCASRTRKCQHAQHAGVALRHNVGTRYHLQAYFDAHYRGADAARGALPCGRARRLPPPWRGTGKSGGDRASARTSAPRQATAALNDQCAARRTARAAPAPAAKARQRRCLPALAYP